MKQVFWYCILATAIAVHNIAGQQFCSSPSKLLRELDATFFSVFPEELVALSGTGIATRPDGLIGRNAAYGYMVSPRFQLGSGRATRFASAAGEYTPTTGALRAMEVGWTTVDPSTGEMKSLVPPDAPSGYVLSAGDIASAASFFMGDACAGMIAIQQSHSTWSDLKMRVTALLPNASLATTWLLSQESVLNAYDDAAPNRLLFDARASIACGLLLNNTLSIAAGHRYIATALSLLRDDGSFNEGDGTDTSYQAVAMAIIYDLIAVYHEGVCEELISAGNAASLWLAARVNATGFVTSLNNSRTCDGGESFLGERKLFSYSDAFYGLGSLGVHQNCSSLILPAQRISLWAQQYSSSLNTSCFNFPLPALETPLECGGVSYPPTITTATTALSSTATSSTTAQQATSSISSESSSTAATVSLSSTSTTTTLSQSGTASPMSGRRVLFFSFSFTVLLIALSTH